ncbi:MAG TPA: hypothetical protein DIT65_08020 [Cryomorphaceae bacterium]|nr:hypothetical protein [Cryomorphaceae bacterium]
MFVVTLFQSVLKMAKIGLLIQRFAQQELRNSNAIFSLGLYLAGITYLVYMLGGQNASDSVWNMLLWVVVFFGAISQASRSFEFESGDYFYYYQTVAGPKATIIAKLIYNSLYQLILSVASWALFSWFYGNTVYNPGIFALGLALGCIGFSAILTLANGIAERSGGNVTLSSILSIPLTLPVLKIVSAINIQAMVGAPLEEVYELVGSLFALDIAIGLLAYLLFPYLWQD